MELFEKYYAAAVNYLSRRPRSEQEVRDNLLKKSVRFRKREPVSDEVHDDFIEKVIQLLKEQKFLDDREFAGWWREQRTRFRAKSDKLIKLELRQKGISAEIIDEVFSEEREETETDLQKATKLAEKRITRLRGMEKHEVYQKLGGFLARRGFNWDTIKRSIDDVWEKEYNNR